MEVAVHIYAGLIAGQQTLLDNAPRILSTEERERAARFKSDAAREEFVVSRLMLRQVLAGHLSLPAEGLVLAYTPEGKPYLCRPPRTGVEFNLSHSHGRLLIAVCHDFPVGIDIERIDPAIDPLALASNALPVEDVQRLRAAAETDRHGEFLAMWTRHEACLKALGRGFVSTGERVRDLQLSARVRLREMAPGNCLVLVQDLDITPDSKAAVALALNAGQADSCPQTMRILVHRL